MIRKNIKELNKLSDEYYKGNPSKSDKYFDELLHKTRELIAVHPDEDLKNMATNELNKIRSEHTNGFETAKHLTPMYSMYDVFTVEEAIQRIKKIYNGEYIVEPKYDGLSLNMIYEDGVLKQAITRGNGITGDDVTANARVVRGIPHKIKAKGIIEVRGEVVMSKAVFHQLNKEKEKLGEKLLSNPRNSATGSLKQLDPVVTASRQLEFYAWGLNAQNDALKTQTHVNEYLTKLGFLKPLFSHLATIDDLGDIYDNITEYRETLPVMIDGLALKINDLSIWDKVGVVDKYPKYQIALKFPHEEYTTIVKDVIWQVGAQGTLTPVAILKPVTIDGVVVTRATLHNIDNIRKRDIMINDTVVIIRSGDVIPKILNSISDKRTGNEIEIRHPSDCPSCGEDLIDNRCVNQLCPDIVKSKLLHFVSKDRFNIKGFGPSIIEILVKNHNISTYEDILNITEEQLRAAVGVKTARTIYRNIVATKGMPVDRFIAAIGIPNIGRRAAKSITDMYGMNFTELTYDELIRVKGIGKELASEYVNYMNKNRNMVYSLISIISPTIGDSGDGKLKGINVVITGTMKVKRSDLKDKIEALGGKISSSVSKNTSVVLYGENAGSKKDKGLSLEILTADISTLSMDEIIDLLNSVTTNPF